MRVVIDLPGLSLFFPLENHGKGVVVLAGLFGDEDWHGGYFPLFCGIKLVIMRGVEQFEVCLGRSGSR